MKVAKDAPERRRVILDAAHACFLQYGYGKTSLDDIAKRARLTRSLLYRTFQNKEEIFAAVYDEFYTKQYPVVDAALAGRGSRKDKLSKVCEIVFVNPWALMHDAPAALEFFDACGQVAPEVDARHKRKWTESVRSLLGDKEAAEVFLLAIEGFFVDMPSVAVLRKRIAVMVDYFGA